MTFFGRLFFVPDSMPILFPGVIYFPSVGYSLGEDRFSAIFPVPFLVYGREKR